MKNKKKSMLITIVAILTLLVIVGGATYAYFTAQTGGGNTSPVTVTTNTTDSLTFIEGTAINLYVETNDFGQGAGNKVGTTTTKANLIANNYTNTATANYNVFFIVDGNTFEYTTDDQKAELIMSVTDPNGNAVTSIDGLEYVTSGGVSGFDITARANNQNLTGSFLIASDYEISAILADGATGPAQTEQSWTVTVTLVNLDTDQNANTGKTFSARVVITKDEETTYEIAQINSATTTTTATTATVTLDDITPGTYDLEKYFFGVEEVTSTTAFQQMTNNILRLGNNLLAVEEDATWYESSSSTYTFTGLKDDTSYIFYIYALDKNGIKTSTYATAEVKTLVYTLAQVSASATSTYNTITITASGTAGSGTIDKYYYTVDYKSDGSTEWEPVDGTTETTYTATDLISDTAYNVAVKAIDSNGRETNPYVLQYSTSQMSMADVCSSGDNLAECTKKLYISDGKNDLYYHDEVGTYENASLEAGDNSYRYTGANPNNYVCFGSDEEECPTDNLYRIIGVFGDQIKLIKADLTTTDHLGSETAHDISRATSTYANYKGSMSAASTHYWSGTTSNNSNTWANSTLNTIALNTTYINYLGSSWVDKIATTTWKVGGNTQANIRAQNAKTAYTNEIVTPAEDTTYNDEIGLMYVSDYMYGAEPIYWSYVGVDTETTDYRVALDYNWIGLGATEWTISRCSDTTYNVFNIYPAGYVYAQGVAGNYDVVRPVFYLNSSVTYVSGNGTSSSPIVIN